VKTLAILIGLVIVFMVGFWLMYTGFRGMVATPSSFGPELLLFLAGLIFLIAGLIAGVFFLKPEYRT
jgi:uncharacterized membrane protein